MYYVDCICKSTAGGAFHLRLIDVPEGLVVSVPSFGDDLREHSVRVECRRTNDGEIASPGKHCVRLAAEGPGIHSTFDIPVICLGRDVKQ